MTTSLSLPIRYGWSIRESDARDISPRRRARSTWCQFEQWWTLTIPFFPVVRTSHPPPTASVTAT
jgi:hypothetical protein